MLLLLHDLGLVLILRVPSTGADSHFISIHGMCSRDLTNKQSIGTWEGTLPILAPYIIAHARIHTGHAHPLRTVIRYRGSVVRHGI